MDAMFKIKTHLGTATYTGSMHMTGGKPYFKIPYCSSKQFEVMMDFGISVLRVVFAERNIKNRTEVNLT